MRVAQCPSPRELESENGGPPLHQKLTCLLDFTGVCVRCGTGRCWCRRGSASDLDRREREGARGQPGCAGLSRAGTRAQAAALASPLPTLSPRTHARKRRRSQTARKFYNLQTGLVRVPYGRSLGWLGG